MDNRSVQRPRGCFRVGNPDFLLSAERLAPALCVLDLLLAVALVPVGKMRVGDMNQIERSFQTPSGSDFRKQSFHGRFFLCNLISG